MQQNKRLEFREHQDLISDYYYFAKIYTNSVV